MSLRFWNTFYILSQIQTCPQIALCELGRGFLVLQDMIFSTSGTNLILYFAPCPHVRLEHYLNAMRMKAGLVKFYQQHLA